MLVEEADYLSHLYRWTLMTGEVPRAQDWLRREDWPHPDHVIDVFGSWDKFLAHAELPSSPLLAKVREAEAARRDLAAREKAREKEAGRAEDLRRQVETARRRREAAEAERDQASTRAARSDRALEAAEERAARAEARLAERREAAAAAEAAEAAPDAAGADDHATAARERAEALADELDAVRTHREELLRRVEELTEAAERDRRALARLSALLAEGGAADAGAADARELPPPATVLEAVQRAAETADHLVFTPGAFESAEDSPYRRPVEVLEALRALDALAGRFAAGEMGVSLVQAASEAGLTYKQGVSEIARSRNPHHYSVGWEGHRLELGPHVALGSGSGAGFIARIYLHVADGTGEVPRGLYVGHVGRHLPDTTT
jgi:chemotaxis protein histidine kinase CheA